MTREQGLYVYRVVSETTFADGLREVKELVAAENCEAAIKAVKDAYSSNGICRFRLMSINSLGLLALGANEVMEEQTRKHEEQVTALHALVELDRKTIKNLQTTFCTDFQAKILPYWDPSKEPAADALLRIAERLEKNGIILAELETILNERGVPPDNLVSRITSLADLAYRNLKDKERMDYLECEEQLEKAPLVVGARVTFPLFRRNCPITRDSVDKVIEARNNV